MKSAAVNEGIRELMGIALARLDRDDADGLAADLRRLLEEAGTPMTVRERVAVAELAVTAAADALLAEVRADDRPDLWAAWSSVVKAQRALIVASERLEQRA